MVDTAIQFLNRIGQAVFDKSGFNIFALDVRDVSTMTDYLFIAEGNVDRHVIALAKKILEEADKGGWEPLHTEGMSNGEWVVIDFVDVVIHLFIPEVREHYALEELWGAGKIVDLEINVPIKEPDHE